MNQKIFHSQADPSLFLLQFFATEKNQMYNFEICIKDMNIPFVFIFYLFYLLPLLCAIILYNILLAACQLCFSGMCQWATGITGSLPSQELLPQGDISLAFFTPWYHMTVALYEPPPS